MKVWMLVLFSILISISSIELKAASRSTKEQASSCRLVSKATAMRAVASRYNGKVLSASINAQRQPPIYRVKVISKSGRVRSVAVNACNGRVLG